MVCSSFFMNCSMFLEERRKKGSKTIKNDLLFFISFAYFIKKSMENVYAFFDSIIEPFYMEWSYAFASWNDTYIFHLPSTFCTEKGRNGDQMVYDTRTGAKKEIFFIFCP